MNDSEEIEALAKLAKSSFQVDQLLISRLEALELVLQKNFPPVYNEYQIVLHDLFQEKIKNGLLKDSDDVRE